MGLTTYSIVAQDPQTGELGVAVQSKFLSVGAVVPWAAAGAGAIATQAFANTRYGPEGLALLAEGNDAETTLARLTAADDGRDDRQAGIVDAHGNAATFTGARCIPWAGGVRGVGFCAQGNCLVGPQVVDAMAQTFRAESGTLSHRLVAALAAGQAQGGDARGQQSAALIVVKPGGGYAGFNDRYVDLRVDDHPAPIDELARLLELHALYFFPPAPHEIYPIDGERGAELVRELVRVGRLPSGHGTFDAAARDALIAFMHVENLENRVRDDGAIDRQTLDYLRAYGA